MKNKGTIIAVSVVVLALLVSAGIAVAAGVSGDGSGDCRSEDGVSRAAGDAFSFGCRNGGEESNIRAENCVGEKNGECDGDCDQEKLRERDCDGECDGTCDGDGEQNRNGYQEEEDAAQGPQARAGTQNGECAGDCDRIQDRLCDGTCDGTCDGDGTQSQNRGGE